MLADFGSRKIHIRRSNACGYGVRIPSSPPLFSCVFPGQLALSF
nr:MAG TPA: hypothetical protein [Caudoviricetes sp.]